MHIILGEGASDNFDVRALTYLKDHIPQAGFHVSKENRLAVYGDKHKLVLDVIYGMRDLAILIYNPLILLSLTLKARNLTHSSLET